MRTPGSDETTPRSTTHRHSRRVVLIAATTLAILLATASIVSALSGGSPRLARSTAAPASAIATAPSAPSPATPATPTASPSGQSTSIPAVSLADGTYPTYVRHVDLAGATITVDVIQVFEGQDATDAAIEDGSTAAEAQYVGIYVRNQNSLLRTFPVADDVRIDFIGECETPDPRVALSALAKATMHFTDTYYYAITIRDGVIQQVTQRIAEAAC